MAIYLQMRVGPLGILVDALRVHEVLVCGEDLRSDSAFAEWREQVLPVVRLARHLELPEVPEDEQHAVVYSPGAGSGPMMLRVHEVARLRQIDPGQWSPMPRVPVRTARLFDAVWWDDAAGGQVYRLRSELEPALLGAQPQEDEDFSAPAPT